MVLVFTFVLKFNHLNVNTSGFSGLESAIIRNLILGFIPSIFTSILCIVMIASATLHFNIPVLLIYAFMMTDIVINAICLLLTYRYFEKTYVVCCGALDAKCISIYEHHDRSRILSTSAELSKKDQTKTTPSPDADVHTANLENLE